MADDFEKLLVAAQLEGAEPYPWTWEWVYWRGYFDFACSLPSVPYDGHYVLEHWRQHAIEVNDTRLALTVVVIEDFVEKAGPIFAQVDSRCSGSSSPDGRTHGWENVQWPISTS